MYRLLMIIGLSTLLTACSSDSDNFTPRAKTAEFDAKTQSIAMPHPCPDWSQTQTENYRNEMHSDFGCSVNTNNALQIANPNDLVHGRGSAGPDTEITIHTVEQYRAGEIPKPLTPLQSTGTSQ